MLKNQDFSFQNFLKCTAAMLVASTFSMLPSVSSAATQEDTLIRKNLTERIPGLPKIDEIKPMGFLGLFEVRIGKDIAYTDAKGEYLIRGSLLHTPDKRDLTQERLEQLQRVTFKDLPLDGAIVEKKGTGERKVVIFEDPNCGYCKKFESEISGVPNLTVYSVIIPILGVDSVNKAQNVWCSKDRNASWTDWMLRNVTPAKMPDCATPFASNLKFAKENNISATPMIFFEDGSRKAGAIELKDFENRLKLASAAAKK